MHAFVIGLLVGVGHATEPTPLILDWASASDVRYHLESMISTPKGFRFLGTANIDARAFQTGIAMDLSCSGEAQKKGFYVHCTIDSAQLEAVSLPDEQERMKTIMDEYGAILTRSQVDLVVTTNGRIRQVDVEGVSKKDERSAMIHEYLRQIVRKAVTPMETQLPKSQSTDTGPWKHKGTPLGFELFTQYGTAGGTTHKYEIGPTVGDTVVINAFGRGNVSTGLELDNGMAGSMNMIVSGQIRHDPAVNLPAYGQISANGEISGQLGTADASAHYAHAGWFGRINPDGSIEGPEGPVPQTADATEQAPATAP